MLLTPNNEPGLSNTLSYTAKCLRGNAYVRGYVFQWDLLYKMWLLCKQAFVALLGGLGQKGDFALTFFKE